MGISNWLAVGPVSAERDQNLKHYFYDAGVSKALIEDPTRFLMLGRKGAGKTAVFLHLRDRPLGLFENTDLVVPMSIGEYNWRAHQALADPNKTSGAQYRDSWRFVVAIESIRHLTTHFTEAGNKIPPSITKAHKLLNKMFGTPVPSWSDILRNKIFSLSKLKLPSGGIGADSEEVSLDAGEISFSNVEADTSLRSSLAFNIEHLTTYLELSLTAGLDKSRVFIIFDKVDEDWLPDVQSLEKSKEMIGGLIQASEHITQKFNGKLRPIVFLREDIFESLDTINDKNKLRMDCSRMLMWTKESLNKLVLARINHFASLDNQTRLGSVDEIFTNLDGGQSIKPMDYIYERTFCRPRDFVAYLVSIIDVIKDNERVGDPNEDSQGKLLTQLLFDAESAYSEYLFKELIDEWKSQRPAIYGYLDILSNLEFVAFSASRFEAEFKNVFRSGATSNTVRAVLAFLFEISVIGYKLGTSKRCFRCFYVSRRFEDLPEYLVHPGIMKYLGLSNHVVSE